MSRATDMRACLVAIRSLRVEHGEEGWDGEDAKPVSHEAIRQSVALVRAMPDTIPVPDVGADNGGDVALDWRSPLDSLMRDHLVTTSVDGTGRIVFAWLRGAKGDSGYSTVEFDGQRFPEPLRAIVADIIGTKGT